MDRTEIDVPNQAPDDLIGVLFTPDFDSFLEAYDHPPLKVRFLNSRLAQIT